MTWGGEDCCAGSGPSWIFFPPLDYISPRAPRCLRIRPKLADRCELPGVRAQRIGAFQVASLTGLGRIQSDWSERTPEEWTVRRLVAGLGSVGSFKYGWPSGMSKLRARAWKIKDDGEGGSLQAACRHSGVGGMGRAPSRVGVASGWRGGGLGMSGGHGCRSCVASCLGKVREILPGVALCARRPVLGNQCLAGPWWVPYQSGTLCGSCVRAPNVATSQTLPFGAGNGALFVHFWSALSGFRGWVGSGRLPQAGIALPLHSLAQELARLQPLALQRSECRSPGAVYGGVGGGGF